MEAAAVTAAFNPQCIKLSVELAELDLLDLLMYMYTAKYVHRLSHPIYGPVWFTNAFQYNTVKYW